jgi:hypothetical protein
MRMKIRNLHIFGLISAVMLIISCFLPWTYYNSLHETFTGFHVLKFANGNYYGRAGLVITILTAIAILLMFVKKIWAKRVNLFIAGVVFAYVIRTYIIFTSSLFPGEVTKKPGIYLVLMFSIFFLVSTLFPKVEEKTHE